LTVISSDTILFLALLQYILSLWLRYYCREPNIIIGRQREREVFHAICSTQHNTTQHNTRLNWEITNIFNLKHDCWSLTLFILSIVISIWSCVFVLCILLLLCSKFIFKVCPQLFGSPTILCKRICKYKSVRWSHLFVFSKSFMKVLDNNGDNNNNDMNQASVIMMKKITLLAITFLNAGLFIVDRILIFAFNRFHQFQYPSLFHI
jgi:hypothetical protein